MERASPRRRASCSDGRRARASSRMVAPLTRATFFDTFERPREPHDISQSYLCSSVLLRRVGRFTDLQGDRQQRGARYVRPRHPRLERGRERRAVHGRDYPHHRRGPQAHAAVPGSDRASGPARYRARVLRVPARGGRNAAARAPEGRVPVHRAGTRPRDQRHPAARGRRPHAGAASRHARGAGVGGRAMRRFIMVAVADLMLCIAAQAMMIYEDEFAAREQEFAAREEAIREGQEELDRARKRVEIVIAKRESEAEQDLTKVRAAIALAGEQVQRLRSRQWEIITTRFENKQKKNDKDDKREFGRLYCMLVGLKTDPLGQTLTDEEVRSWIATLPETTKEIALYVENGANDEYHHGRSLVRASDRIDHYTFVLLPSDLKPRDTSTP